MAEKRGSGGSGNSESQSSKSDALPGPSSRKTGEDFKNETVYQLVKRQIDLESLVSKSLSTLKLPKVVDATKTQSQLALTSLVKVIESKSLTAQEKMKDNETTDQFMHHLDVLDYFAAKDGLKYIGFLEQLQYSYDNKCKAYVYNVPDKILEAVEVARQKIEELCTYHYVSQEKEMHDFDYPVIAERILHHFPIDASRKLHEIAKFHSYGIKMILHWVYVIQRQTKTLDINIFETFATELLADIMVPSFALFIHFAEFIICMADAPPNLKEGYPLEDIISYLRRFYEALAMETGAIAESVGEVMVRLPGISRDLVVEKMTKIYYAVNHCNYTSSKVLESLSPMLLYYQIRYLLGNAALDSSIDTTHDFKRFTGQRRKTSLAPLGNRYKHSTGY